MNNKHVVSQKHKLDSLFDCIKDLRQLNNFELESQWARYLCVRVSGFLETSLRSIYNEYCKDKAHPHIIAFIGDVLEPKKSLTQNIIPEKLLNLAGAFNSKWRVELELYITDKGRKEAIESVVNIRNSIAHGGTQNITYNTIKEYYASILEVIDFIELQCDSGKIP